MLRRLLISWVVIAIAVAVAVYFVPGVTITGGPWQVLLVAAVFGLISAILGPILRLFSLPLIVLTLGLFTLVINFVLFLITNWIMPSLQIDGLWPAFLASLLISIVSAVLWALLRSD
jgi:putative membrane protein